MNTNMNCSSRTGNAAYATLNHRAVSPAAMAFVGQIASLVEDQERLTKLREAEVKAAEGLKKPRVNKRGAQGSAKLWEAVESFLGDLLTAAANEEARGWVYRRLGKGDFSEERVGIRTFSRLHSALSELGLVDHIKGAQWVVRNQFHEGPGQSYAKLDGAGQASRFRATESLLALALREGVDTSNIDEHFAPRLPQHPLVLMTASYRTGREKHDGVRMGIKHDDTTKALEAEVKALNAFLETFAITGGGFHGFIRVFNQGDDDGFRWNKGGRLYGVSDSRGHNFQLLPSEQRLTMTIGGEAVVEIDITASYLTMLHSLHGVPFDPTAGDPYDIPEYTRPIVKAWLTATLGHKQHFDKWPEKTVERLRKKGFDNLPPIHAVRDAMLARYPILCDWAEQRVTWADLMYAESNAVIATMTRLMHEQRPSLPVHDSIIVRASDQERAVEVLQEEYHKVSGIYPKLKVICAAKEPEAIGTAW